MDTTRRLGSRYTLDRLLGEGASGQVWLGHDADGQERAVKLLRSELATDSTVVQRFVQERSLLASIVHPNVVRVHDLVVEGDSLAIVMDYVDGRDLRLVVREQGPQPPADVARLGHQIAAALAATHAKDVVHRDVKPENVLLDPSGAARLSDFGIAKILDGSRQATMMLGTPLYMAPELAEGHDPGPAADVYSLGILLYEMSCGISPFAGRPGAMGVLRAHVNEAPGRPEGVPDPLWDLIARMVAKDPAARPSATAVAETLASLQDTLAGTRPAPRLTSPPPTVPVAAVPAATILSQPGAGAAARAEQQTSLAGQYPGVQQSAPGMQQPGPPMQQPGPPMQQPGTPMQQPGQGVQPGPGASYPGAYQSYPPMYGSPTGAPPAGSPVGGYGYPGPYMVAPPTYPTTRPPEKNRTPLVVGALVGALVLGAAAVFYVASSRNSGPPAAANASPSSSAPVVTQTVTASAPTQNAAPTPPPAPAPRPQAPAAAPSVDEANGAVMDYTDRFASGMLGSSDMSTLFTPTVDYYNQTLSRPALQTRLNGVDRAQNARTYDRPVYQSFGGPTSYGGEAAAAISYYVTYQKPTESGRVVVTYTVVKGSDGVSRIRAISERPG